MQSFKVCTKQIRTGSWHGVEEPVSSRLGSEHAKPSTSLRTRKMDLLGMKRGFRKHRGPV